MLKFLRRSDKKYNVPIPIEFSQDLNWFLEFLRYFNGVTFFDHKPCLTFMGLEVCPTELGGRLSNQIYTMPFDANVNNYNVIHIEMLNVLVALRI